MARPFCAISLSSLAWVALGCGDIGRNGTDPRVPGESLGGFSVVATLADSTCGPGALGAPDKWEFDVRLSREGAILFWLNGQEAIAGDIASDGISFSFDSRTRVQAVPPGPRTPGCAVVRVDHAQGVLRERDDEVKGFDGRLSYGYVGEAGSDCSSLLGVEGGFAALPCDLEYAIAGERTSEPTE